MMSLSPSKFVLRAVSGVRAADVEQALLMLPFSDALRLLRYLSHWLRRGMQVGSGAAFLSAGITSDENSDTVRHNTTPRRWSCAAA